MNEDPYLTLNLTITFSLPLDDPEMCFDLLEELRRVARPGCMPQESSYLIKKQIEKAEEIIRPFRTYEEPPDELG